jgi:hypothetical protein
MFLTDNEIAELCKPLVQPAAQVRYLRSLKLQVTTKPNGRPVVVRSHAEAVLSGTRLASAEADKTISTGGRSTDRGALLELFKGKHGSAPKAQPA